MSCNFFIPLNVDITAPLISVKSINFDISSISSALNADVYMDTTYSADILNNSFLIYANDLTNIQNAEMNNLKFCINTPYDNILPKCTDFTITTNSSYCGYLSINSREKFRV
jgi:hypothetical protein